jgi:hypothetical protein
MLGGVPLAPDVSATRVSMHLIIVFVDQRTDPSRDGSCTRYANSDLPAKHG